MKTRILENSPGWFQAQAHVRTFLWFRSWQDITEHGYIREFYGTSRRTRQAASRDIDAMVERLNSGKSTKWQSRIYETEMSDEPWPG